MGFLGSLFNDTLDIVTAPVKLVAKLTDKVMDTETEDFIEEVKESIKSYQRKVSRYERL